MIRIFQPFLSSGPFGNSNASRSSPKSPQDRPRSPFLSILGSFLCQIVMILEHNKCQRRRERNSKKGNISSCFLTVLGDKTSGTVHNSHAALQATGDTVFELRQGLHQEPPEPPQASLFTDFWELVEQISELFRHPKCQRASKKNPKKGQHSVLFLKIFW